jgi:hypothetical protein
MALVQGMTEDMHLHMDGNHTMFGSMASLQHLSLAGHELLIILD